MSVSNNQWASPAHVGDWLMDVNDRRHPTELLVRRGRTPVLTVSISAAEDVSTKADDLVTCAGLSRGVANQLVMQLAAKLAVTDGRP